MTCRSRYLVQVLIAGTLILHLLHDSAQAHIHSHPISKDWKRSFHWQGQAPAHDDGIDWASLDKDLQGPQSPSSSDGGSSSTSRAQGFTSWLRSYNYDLGEEYKRANYLRRYPTGPSADAYRQQPTRSVEEIRQYLSDHHPEAYQRLTADGWRQTQKYEAGFKALREQAAANTISDADREKLETYENRIKANQARYRQKKKATRQ